MTVALALVDGGSRSANVLCAGSEGRAVTTFMEARLDHRVVELAPSAVLLGTRFRDWGPVSSQVRRSFLDSCQSVRCLGPTESAPWDILGAWHSWAMVPAGEDATGWRSAALSQLKGAQ